MMKNACIHIWIIAPPDGPTSKGECSACGVNKDFPNAIPEDAWPYDIGARARERSRVKVLDDLAAAS